MSSASELLAALKVQQAERFAEELDRCFEGEGLGGIVLAMAVDVAAVSTEDLTRLHDAFERLS